MDLFSNNLIELPFMLPNEPGFSSIWCQELNAFQISVPHGSLIFAPKKKKKKISDRSVEYFLENSSGYGPDTDWKSLSAEDLAAINFDNIKWKQEYINLYGLKPLPRLTAWYGDSGRVYSYSGITQQPNPWNKGLLYMKETVEQISNAQFNSVLLNWYRNGDDYLNWHTDDEKELGSNPTIASVNFGETRDFQLRLNENHDIKINIPLSHGSVLIMAGELQHYWQHCVPKRKKVTKSRFNLTFRFIN